MSTVKLLVERFVANDNYDAFDHEIAQKWMNAVGRSDDNVLILTSAKNSLQAKDRKRRDKIREETRSFIRSYFDDRPKVVKSLDSLFAELGLEDESKRRKEFFSFKDLYSREEILVLLLKHLQQTSAQEPHTQADIAEYFLTSPRTIGVYIRELQTPMDPGQIAKVLGQQVYADTARGTNTPETTQHPLFLPLNMVELYALVDVLAEHVDDQVEGRVIGSVLEHIAGQTTEYADKRLKRIKGFAKAKKAAEHPADKSDNGKVVIVSEKEQLPAVVRYVDQGREKTYKGMISRSFDDRRIIKITGEDGVVSVLYQDIIHVENVPE